MKYRKIVEGNREATLVQSHMVYENQFTECLDERAIIPLRDHRANAPTGHELYEEWR